MTNPKPNLQHFRFELPIQMRWNDLDPLGHVNNAIFITYFEYGRSQYMLKASSIWDWTKNMFLIGDVQAVFHKELTLLHTDARVLVRTHSFGNKSFVLEYAVCSGSKDNPILHSHGKTTQIMFDTKSRSTIEIPQWLREEISAFEKYE
ncbi:MAG: thioesterase [Saprospirales bacterium]|nr:thioesterase [Saprospirales bacterium]|tara:strand:+ start:2509 stop:2952 length:444 start_codon:yes stop_codon:yes gene_type:complete